MGCGCGCGCGCRCGCGCGCGFVRVYVCVCLCVGEVHVCMCVGACVYACLWVHVREGCRYEYGKTGCYNMSHASAELILSGPKSVPHLQGWPEPYIYMVCIWYFWQGNHWIYGHIRCIYAVLANPTHLALRPQVVKH